jgi:hypothetical protein
MNVPTTKSLRKYDLFHTFGSYVLDFWMKQLLFFRDFRVGLIVKNVFLIGSVLCEHFNSDHKMPRIQGFSMYPIA